MNDPLSGGAENAEPEPTTPQPANAVDALRRAALAGVARSSSLPGRFAQFAAQKAGAERPAVERVLARRGVLWLVLLHPALNLLEKTPVDVLLNKHLLPLVLSERARYLDLKGTLKADPGRHGADPLSGALEDSEDEDEADEKSKSWDRYFQDTQLRATINQDVTRTFQDHPLFREPATQRVLDEVLFVWARQHGDIGYRQGMHEVAAIVFWVLHGDRALDPALASDADPTWNALESPAEADVEADCHAIFSLIMKLLLMPFYMHKPPATATAAGLANPAPAAAKPARPTPLLATSARIFHSLLAKTDPQLYRCLRANGVEEQVWGVRWLRLLFSREVPPDSHDEDAEDGSRTASVLRKVVEMWTVIFAGIGLGDLGEERGRQVVEWTAVEMLVAVRDKVLAHPKDPTFALQSILRYSPPAPLDTLHPARFVLRALSRIPESGTESPKPARWSPSQRSPTQIVEVPVPAAPAPISFAGLFAEAQVATRLASAVQNFSGLVRSASASATASARGSPTIKGLFNGLSPSAPPTLEDTSPTGPPPVPPPKSPVKPFESPVDSLKLDPNQFAATLDTAVHMLRIRPVTDSNADEVVRLLEGALKKMRKEEEWEAVAKPDLELEQEPEGESGVYEEDEVDKFLESIGAGTPKTATAPGSPDVKDILDAIDEAVDGEEGKDAVDDGEL